MAQVKPLAIIAGAGPGLGQALLQRFALGGYLAIGLARSLHSAPEGTQIHQLDLADPQAASSRLAQLIADHGTPAVVVHNAAHLSISPFLQTSDETFEALWRNMVLSAFNLAQAVMPNMTKAGKGAFLVSGATASLRGGANFSAFASAKFALRGLTQSLAREFQPKGLHVAHIILDGLIDTKASRERTKGDPARMMKPEDIAEAYWHLAHQPISTWTQELDLRPQSETF